MIKETSRSAALDCLLPVAEGGAFSHTVLNSAREKYAWMSVEDRSFITRLVHGTLERMVQLDWCLDRISSVPVRKMKPLIRNLLRLSAYQILFLDRVPDRAAVHEAVETAKARGFRSLSGFVNAVLRRLGREKEDLLAALAAHEDMSIRCSAPEGLVRMFSRELGPEEAERTLKAFLGPARLYIRPLSGAVSEPGTEPSPFCPDVFLLPEGSAGRLNEHPLLSSGRAIVQDLSSAIAVRAAIQEPGSSILDLCAAPGGKSIAAADLMKGTGSVLSLDLSEEKTALLQRNVDAVRFGEVIRTGTGDARIRNTAFDDRFDLVIADLPCSGLGVLGRKPDIRLRFSEERIEELSALQKEILQNAGRYVKPGGLLLYSTCTISRRENEDNRAWFLSAFPSYRPEPLDKRLSFLPGSDGIASLPEGFIQLLPGRFPADGFFFSLFRRQT